MSWSRFGEGDVYVFPAELQDGGGIAICCGCWLNEDGEDFYSRDLEAMVEHLQAHRDAGHKVPDYTEPEMRADWSTYIHGDGIEVSP